MIIVKMFRNIIKKIMNKKNIKKCLFVDENELGVGGEGMFWMISAGSR